MALRTLTADRVGKEPTPRMLTTYVGASLSNSAEPYATNNVAE